MMVSMAAITDIRRGDATRANRCIPLCSDSVYSSSPSPTSSHSQLSSCSSCSHFPTTSTNGNGGDNKNESDWSPTPSLSTLPPHPTISSIGRLFAPHDFDILESLGEGFFSLVHKVRIRASGEVLVLKVAKGVGTRSGEHCAIAREMRMLKRLTHPNVIALQGVCIERNKLGWDAHLLMDYCSCGSLSRLILDSSRQMSWPERGSYALDIAKAMHYIHSRGVMHRDLTSMNVLLQKRPRSDPGWDRAIVADFGLSCELPKNGEILPQVGTTYFMSPQCLNEEYYDGKNDVFAFGIILCQLIARIDADPDSGLHRTSGFGVNYVLFTTYCPPDTPYALLQLAFTCCLMNPASRPPFSSIVSDLSRMPLIRPPSPESMKRIEGGKLGRSRSDAALRNQNRIRMSLRKPSQRGFHSFSHNIHPVTEGLVSSTPPPSPCTELSALELLARGVANTETEDSEESWKDWTMGNPFLDHERYRHERKIVPHRDQTRRRSETKPDYGSLSIGMGMDGGMGRGVRRWSSMPSAIDKRSTVDGRDGMDEERDVQDSTVTGGIPMAFRDWDQTFIREAKTMQRFPSRRHTLTPTVHEGEEGDGERPLNSPTLSLDSACLGSSLSPQCSLCTVDGCSSSASTCTLNPSVNNNISFGSTVSKNGTAPSLCLESSSRSRTLPAYLHKRSSGDQNNRCTIL